MIVTITFLLLGFAPHTFAQGFVPLAPIPNLTQGVVADSAGLANFLNNLYKYLIGLAAAIAVVQIIWSGLKIAFNKESIGSVTESKGRIAQAIFGLVLVLSPALVFSIINPSILNLSLNLPPLYTQTGASSGVNNITAGVQAPARDSSITDAVAAGCQVVTSTITQTMSCPNQASADAFVSACVQKGGTGDVSSLPLSSKYQATCNQPASVACTLARTGPYMETAVCASLTDANSYKCTNGLDLRVPSCKTSNTNGTCADTSVAVYCTGRQTTVGVYEYYTTLTNLTGFGNSNTTILPSDKPTYDAFVSGCQNDGGKPTLEITIASTVFLSSRSYLVSNGCSSDAGIPPFNRNQYSGVRCFNNTLSCNPPQ
ncbi:MAG: pilin [Minisyncoccia bacterium]